MALEFTHLKIIFQVQKKKKGNKFVILNTKYVFQKEK